MKTSRQQILEYVQQQRAVTIPQLSLALRSTQANVRHHLNILMQQGLVTVVGVQPAQGRGRPAQIFGPPPASRGSNLPLLTHLLLDRLDPAQAGEFGQALASAMQPGGSADGAGNAAHPTQRLGAAVEALNRAYYEAHWEPRPNAPQLILGHCPYWQVIGEHAWLCRVDAALLESLLGAPVEHTQRLVDDGKQGQRCVFQIMRPAKRP